MRRSVLCVPFLALTIAVSVMAQQSAGVGLRIIVVKTEEEAVGLQSRLQGGERFEDLAKKYSTDDSASSGGYFGNMVVGDLRKEFQDALAGLGPGQVSPILRISEKYILLQVVTEAEAHYYLGYALAGEGKLDEAVDEFLNALRINPDYAESHTSLGNALGLQGKWDQAVAEHREALRINPQYVEAHNSLGIALLEQGNVDEAIGEYREALRIDPQYAEAHYNLGNALGDQGKLDEAVGEYRGSAAHQPQLR